ncbi:MULTISPECIES: HdeD family acid-resistance protein [Microbacterium]|uniref:HdeD family acid-resistance protein n=1 Tax=Microbacterium TaxID=33882 RepID=UPI00217D6557|nr:MULTISPECIES: DUF308 domain-containing protein [Microbacterium]UWF76588.1 DUF308 domain-containing protein [Microbacterium neungamense]WCM54740.1 DUF308 domain-containing protein [Microbacterium sp. EF45047]
MSDLTSGIASFARSVRLFLLLSGVLAALAGLVLLIWPAKSAVIVTGIVAAYLIVGGLIYLGLGIFSRQEGGWARIGHILLGLLYILAGALAYANLPAATVALALVTVIFIGASWIVDGVVALSLMGMDGSKAWTLIYALLSIAAGVVVLLSPLFAAAVLWIFLGAALLVLGVTQIVRAVMIGRAASAVAEG